MDDEEMEIHSITRLTTVHSLAKYWNVQNTRRDKMNSGTGSVCFFKCLPIIVMFYRSPTLENHIETFRYVQCFLLTPIPLHVTRNPSILEVCVCSRQRTLWPCWVPASSWQPVRVLNWTKQDEKPDWKSEKSWIILNKMFLKSKQ